MNKPDELKARLRRFSFKAADFSDNKSANKIKKVEYVRLDMALSAIDELMKKEVMTPENSRWKEFVILLEGPEGCNFIQTDPNDPKSITWTCDNSTNKPLARAILQKMGNIDIEKTMKYFEEHGGYCDCEILLNVNPDDDDPRSKK